MAVVVRCASCRRQVKVRERLAGHRVTCPRYGDALPVPLPETVPEAAPPPAPDAEGILNALPPYGRIGLSRSGWGSSRSWSCVCPSWATRPWR
jgi:hypothetical protein